MQYDRRAMAGFTGGSAWAMARDVAEGHVLVTERTLTRLEGHEMDKLQFELKRLLRSVRGSQPPLDAVKEIQIRQRKMQRLRGAQRLMKSFLLRRRR